MLNVLSWLLKSNVFKKKPTQLVEVVDHCAATKKKSKMNMKQLVAP